MGPAPSRAWHRRAPRPEISERDVLTLCDDGDLLLLRECVVETTLRVAIDSRVAHDIAAFQHGVFPSARLTQLPAWTNCALFLRVRGELHMLRVDAEGMRFVPFHDHVAEHGAGQDTYAVRRLQHVRNDHTAAFLRELTFELLQLLPVAWKDTTTEAMQSFETKLRVHAHAHAAIQRMLQLCGSSLQSLASPIDRSGLLASAFIVAVYEQLGLLQPLDLRPSSILVPSSFADPLPTAPSSGSGILVWTPANALGTAMRLT